MTSFPPTQFKIKLYPNKKESKTKAKTKIEEALSRVGLVASSPQKHALKLLFIFCHVIAKK
jgi:hypothetical protein